MAQDRRQIGGVGPEAFLRAAPIVKIHPIPLEGSNLHCYQTTIASGQAEFLNGPGALRLSRTKALSVSIGQYLTHSRACGTIRIVLSVSLGLYRGNRGSDGPTRPAGG